ncbi:MAG: hypothetical protein NTU83_14725 [Candidatus Hydrogenedentes bacterium]|nr:hypothetical protein [Candidatus Hydrogenedentota bacterium]
MKFQWFEAALFVGTGVDGNALQAGSPGINASRYANVPVLGAVTTNILGVRCGVDGDGLEAAAGDGSEYDTGAYEYVP